MANSGHMPMILIRTSKRGLIWPTEYWKTLIDSLFRKGAKKDPRVMYPDLAGRLAQLVEERDGRFFPRPHTRFSELDDPALDTIIVTRASRSSATVQFEGIPVPRTEDQLEIRVPYFGTIGDRKAEQQTVENRAIITQALGELVLERRTGRLGLTFHLARSRRDRDLDNLADALMPCFNKLAGPLDQLYLRKGSRVDGPDELLMVDLATVPTQV